ncbi:MAG: hypothetical protein FWG85_06990 [Bacteroidetes bacterium]|nr:hypothetical protein [Bacteroidota bacterium]
MELNYEEEYKKQIKANLLKVLDELKTSDMKIKIQKFADKFGYSYNEIEGKIVNDEIFRCVFSKEPSKQNLYQTLAATFINSLPMVENFEILASGGKNAVYIENGKLFTGIDLINKAKEVKSIDFSWNVGKIKFYASHKYTKDSGGAQDNQYLDIQNFLKNARDNNSKDTIFLAICDGKYYQKKDSQTNDETKILRLKRLTDNKTSFVLTINELMDFLKEIK